MLGEELLKIEDESQTSDPNVLMTGTLLKQGHSVLKSLDWKPRYCKLYRNAIGTDSSWNNFP